MQVGEPSHYFPLVWLHAGVIVCVATEGGIPTVLKAHHVELARRSAKLEHAILDLQLKGESEKVDRRKFHKLARLKKAVGLAGSLYCHFCLIPYLPVESTWLFVLPFLDNTIPFYAVVCFTSLRPGGVFGVVLGGIVGCTLCFCCEPRLARATAILV
jgi:hypothetical protein